MWAGNWGASNWGGQDSWGAGGMAAKPQHKPDVCKIYVNKLPPTATQEAITTIFGAHGALKGVDFKTDGAGNSKKFCFVTYEDVSGAKSALADVASLAIDGATLDVKSCGPNGDVNGGQPSDPKTIFAGGLPWEVTENDLTTYFGQFGTVAKITLKTTAEGKPKGFCFVTFEDDETSATCLAYEGHTLNGQKIDVKTAVHGVGKFSGEGKGAGGMKGAKGGKGKGKGGKGDMAQMMQMMQMMNGMNQYGGGGQQWGGMGGYGGNWGAGGGKGKGKGRFTPY